ncbi:MAG: hypothetical protein AAGE84_17925 [Cyanobacteria bacterium P01_G01_bin.39]
MNQPNLPDHKKIKQTVLKSRQERRKLELASLELEELIVQLEQENRHQRSKQLNRI